MLGAWLGDGHSASARITCETAEIPMYLEGYGFHVEPRGNMLLQPQAAGRHQDAHPRALPRLRRQVVGAHLSSMSSRPRKRRALLRKIGVLGDKHIPASSTSAPPSRSVASSSPA